MVAVDPAGVGIPFQLTTSGTRVASSYSTVLCSMRWEPSMSPWSVLNMTTVSSSCPVSLNASSTRPIWRSTISVRRQ